MRRTPEQEAQWSEAEARCSLFTDRGIICRDCECGNETLPFNRDTSPAPWSHEKIKAFRDARDRVVEAAEAMEFAFRDPSKPWGYSVDAKQDALNEAVRALRAVRGDPCR